MKSIWTALLVGLAALSSALAIPRPTLAVDLLIPTEYTPDSGVGANLLDFSRIVTEKTSGKVHIVTKFLGQHEFRSTLDLMNALTAEKIQGADVFGAGVARLDPVFAQAAAPFLAPTLAIAEVHHRAMRPIYATAFRKLGARLLYVTPWPPTGLWSRQPLYSFVDVEGCKIRTYDAVSGMVFTAAGAKVSILSFAELMPRLVHGEFDAVLSSGDGGMGKELWRHLPNYTEINYAFPVSFTVVKETTWESLAPREQRSIEDAAQEIEALQWTKLKARMARNESQMRKFGVRITKAVPSDIDSRFRRAADHVKAASLP
jgi:TRAP-type C4-dicarboxylate transport system substrate-binding protein